MVISITQKNLPATIIERASKATGKGATIDIDHDERNYFVQVFSGERLVGKFIFQIFLGANEDYNEDGQKEVSLIKAHIIDGSFYPLEFTLYHLTKQLKKRKIKYIALRNGIIRL